MPLFAKPKVVLWPKSKSTEIYIDQKENNTLSFDFSLWVERSETELSAIAVFLKQKKITSCSVLIPDDIVFTKSFIYDTKITSIDKKEVIGLVEGFVSFKIDEDSVDYKLIQSVDKTVIQATIYDRAKLDFLKLNLSKVGLKIDVLKPVSVSISSIINTFFSQEYFLVYPLNSTEYTLILSKGDVVYLTSNLKGPSLEVQKIINYSNLYFSNKITKFFISQDCLAEISSTAKLDLTKFSESQIAGELKKPSNFSLPVLGLLVGTVPLTPVSQNSAIINPSINLSTPISKPMENKKNILPIIAVFIVAAVLVSGIIWFIVSKNSASEKELQENKVTETTPTLAPEPTATPVPTIAEINKKIKLQVLNATDINGQAATIKTKLTDLGFSSIATGNNSQKLTENMVRMKPSLATSQSYFESKLGVDFPATYTTDLKESATYDVVFIIGTDLRTGSSAATKSATASPSVTVTKTPTPTTE